MQDLGNSEGGYGSSKVHILSISGLSTISVLRLRARPSAEELSASGLNRPLPAAVSRFGSTSAANNTLTTPLARSVLKDQLSPPLLNFTLSVWPIMISFN